MDVPQSRSVVEAAPVPDLLGSILSGQSVLLMDSSDVVINRDGSLKATKPMMPSVSKPSCSNSSSSGDASTQISPVMSPNQGDSSPSPHYNRDLPGSSHSSTNRPFSHCSSRLQSPASHVTPSSHSDLPPRGHPTLLPPRPVRPTHPPGHWRANGVRAPSPSSSIQPTSDSSSKGKGMTSSQSQTTKAPVKPMWVDVSVLPRIPKIKRESSGITNGGTSQGGSAGSNQSRSSRGNSSNSSTSSNGYGMPETGINSLAGDKGKQQSVDQQKGRADGQAQRQRPDGTSSSSAFSNSFSSFSSTGSSANQPRYSSSSSSSSSAVSFRINSSGNSWQARRLSSSSSSAAGGSSQEHRREKEDEARKRQLHRDKQMLLASRTPVNKEQDSNTIYDPFNPTLSDSSSSEDEAENKSLDGSSRHAALEGMAPSLRNEKGLVQSKQERVPVKTETQANEDSQKEPWRASAQETTSQEVRFSEKHVKVEKESLIETKTEKQTALLDTKVKKEQELDDAGDAERFGHSVKSLNSETANTTPPVQHSLDCLKTERETLEDESGQTAGTPYSAPPDPKNNSSASSSATSTNKQKTETKSDSKSSPKSRDSGHRKTSKERCSSSLETDRERRGDHHASGQGGRRKEKEKDRERSSRRSRSREKKRAHSSSESSQSNSPDRTRRKRRRSRSRSKDRRRSRSGSSSSSREHSRRRKQKRRSKERNDGRERDCERRRLSKDKRRGRSRSKSRSRSRSKEHKRGHSRSKSRSKSRSRSRERRKDHARPQQSSLSSRDKVESRSRDKRRHRSRSRSREKRKDEASSSKSSQKTSGSCVSSSKDTKQLQDKKKEKDITRSSLKEEKVAPVNKQTTSSCAATAEVSKKDKDLKADGQATTAEMAKEVKVGKEIKKEKQPPLDMFEDSPITKEIKKEETDMYALVVTKSIDEEGNKEDPIKTETIEIKTETIEIKTETPEIKTETCEIPVIKSEPSSPDLCQLPPVTSISTLTTSVTTDCLQDTASPSHEELMAAGKQPDTVALTVPVKQEVQQPSDSDDDFNVDVMLDNLDYVKSERTEESGDSVKQEKEVEEGKNEQVSTAVGAKSKSQVKRVTWNIQEPEGPQPEKSASKLALYKLKLKQEGRRPSSTGQTSSQDITGAVSHPSKKGAAGPLSTSSRPDSAQGEAEEGDLSRKDQYLKKLHMQERAIEEVKLAIKPFYQRRDINKEEYKEILRKAVQKVCHSKSGEINPVKVGNLVKAYVDKYKHARKHKKGEDLGQTQEAEAMKTSDSP